MPQNVLVGPNLMDKTNPGALKQILDDQMELTKAETNARGEFYPPIDNFIRVYKLNLFTAEGLKSEKGHLLHYPGDLFDQAAIGRSVQFNLGQ